MTRWSRITVSSEQAGTKTDQNVTDPNKPLYSIQIPSLSLNMVVLVCSAESIIDKIINIHAIDIVSEFWRIQS